MSQNPGSPKKNPFKMLHILVFRKMEILGRILWGHSQMYQNLLSSTLGNILLQGGPLLVIMGL